MSFQLNEEVNQFQRKFVSEVRRCEEMDRKLRFIEAEIIKEGVKIPELTKSPEAPNPRQVIDLEVSSKWRILLDGWKIYKLYCGNYSDLFQVLDKQASRSSHHLNLRSQIDVGLFFPRTSIKYRLLYYKLNTTKHTN